jgi:hypothetical protein
MSRPRLSPTERQAALEACRSDYQALKTRLAQVGFICEGSLVERYMPCGKTNCRCIDPKRRHGPYWQLSWKEAGKTVSRRLSADEARLYREWIDNRRLLESVIEEMTVLSRRAGEHLLEDTGRHFQGPPRPRRRARPAKRTRR